MPVDVAAKGRGTTGNVVIPCEVWDKEVVEAVSGVQVPLKEPPEANLTIGVLEKQGHLVPIER